MTLVSRFRKGRSPIWLVVLALLCAFGCSRQLDVPTEGTAQAGQTPFPEKGANADGAPTNSSNAIGSVPEPQRTDGTNLPFGSSQYVPAGTLLTVRLESPVTAGSAAKGKSLQAGIFRAVMEQPVLIEGNIMIPQGTIVVGRVESSRISKVKPNRGYVRMALESVHLGALDVPVQTASLFAQQVPQDEETIRLEKGRRLTFRLTQAVWLEGPRAQLSR